MADVRESCARAEEWVRENALPVQFPGRTFFKKRLSLSDGGTFEFDAVADDESVIGLVSTSTWKTVTGNANTGAIRKIRSDLLRFTQLPNSSSILVLGFTEFATAEGFLREKNRGKISSRVEIIHFPLPKDIQLLVEAGRVESRSEQRTRPVAAINVEALPAHLRKYVK
ncbi:hypothetical protein [Corallococcus sp. CA054B]|uniref:hypothetical protein n=1 Tax=Corallococcus sp. CA054B TaxID=2316734 RepID=UPI0011C43512|nr:hypothetical protein [Corallococcus sp. CA054B]